MRRLLLGAGLLLLLAACVPRVDVGAVRDGETVAVTIAPDVNLYSVTLSVLNAATDDVRCAVIAEVDVGCALGDIAAGESATVIVTGEAGEVRCGAFAFTTPELALTSYRAYPCGSGGG